MHKHLEAYSDTRAQWLEHLGETIPVLDARSGKHKRSKHASQRDSEHFRTRRFRTANGTRQYWQDQAKFADEVQSQLTALTPEKVDVLWRELNAKLKTLREQSATPQLILAQHVNALKSKCAASVTRTVN